MIFLWRMFIFIIMAMMIKYELKKVLRSKSLIVLLGILLFLNAAQIIYRVYPDHHGSLYEGKKKILAKIEGPITQENYDFLLNNYTTTQQMVEAGDYQTDRVDKNTYSGYVFGDNQLFSELFEDYKSCINYNNNIKNIIKIAKENKQLTNNKTWKEYNNNLLKTYGERNLSYYYDYTLINSYINYEFSFFISLVLIIMITVVIFLKEKQDGTIIYYKLVRNGKKRIFIHKIMVLILTSGITSIIFSLETFIIYFFLGANMGWLQPLYAIADFKFSASSISIASYMIINNLMQILGCIIFALTMMIISRTMKYSYQGIIIGFIILILSILAYNTNFYSVIDFSSVKNLFIKNIELINFIIKGTINFLILIIINYILLFSGDFYETYFCRNIKNIFD